MRTPPPKAQGTATITSNLIRDIFQARKEMTRPSSSESDVKFIPAYKPEDCDRILIDAMEKGDIETTVALYEPDAVLLTESGDLMKVDVIRKHNEEFISLKTKTAIDEIKTVTSGDGSLATARMKCTTIYSDPKTGNQVRLVTNTLEVLRKQPDGTWRFVIDDPFGGTRANKSQSQFSLSDCVFGFGAHHHQFHLCSRKQRP